MENLPDAEALNYSTPAAPAPYVPAPIPTYVRYAELLGHSKPVSVVKFSPTGSLLASGSIDRHLRIWKTDSMCEVVEANCIRAHVAGLNDVSWTYDSRFVATCSDDKIAKLFDVETSKRKLTLRGHDNYVISVSFNANSNLVLTSSFDHTARIWDVRSGNCVKKLIGHKEPVCAANFNHDGTMVCTASYDGAVNIWDTVTGTLFRTLEGIGGDQAVPCSYAKYSPNGRYLLVSKQNSQLYLIDAKKEKVVRTYTGHKNEAYCIFADFAVTGGKYIVSGSEDGHAYIWDLQTAQLLQKLPVKDSSTGDVVICTACDPTKNAIATCSIGSKDHSVRLWRSGY